MLYYKVLRDSQVYNNGKYISLVKNELLTKKQAQKYRVPPFSVRAVDVKPKRTYWFFGARFALED